MKRILNGNACMLYNAMKIKLGIFNILKVGQTQAAIVAATRVQIRLSYLNFRKFKTEIQFKLTHT